MINERTASLSQLGLSILRTLKLLILCLFYLVWLLPTPLLSSSGFTLPFESVLAQDWGGWLVRQFILILFLAMVYITWKTDQRREERGEDDFRGRHLFYRYGEEIFSTAFPIPTNATWACEETSRFATSLRVNLANRIRKSLPEGAAQVLDPHSITNLDTQVKKDFIRVFARSERGSGLVHFIHYAPYGGSITAHYITYVRGHYNSRDIAKLILESPISFWFWILPWLANHYSLAVRISHLEDDPYDLIDLDTMYIMTQYVSLKATVAVLMEADLLTEEIRQIIVNNITNIKNKNSQRFHISGGLVQSVGNVNQAVA
jgi:hypothetical protein